MSQIRWNEDNIRKSLRMILAGELNWLVLGYDATGHSNIIIKCTGDHLPDFVHSFNDKEILMGYINGSVQKVYIHSIPERVGERDRAFSIIHSKKLYREFFNDAYAVQINSPLEINVSVVSNAMLGNVQPMQDILYKPTFSFGESGNGAYSGMMVTNQRSSPTDKPKLPQLPKTRIDFDQMVGKSDLDELLHLSSKPISKSEGSLYDQSHESFHKQPEGNLYEKNQPTETIHKHPERNSYERSQPHEPIQKQSESEFHERSQSHEPTQKQVEESRSETSKARVTIFANDCEVKGLPDAKEPVSPAITSAKSPKHPNVPWALQTSKSESELLSSKSPKAKSAGADQPRSALPRSISLSPIIKRKLKQLFPPEMSFLRKRSSGELVIPVSPLRHVVTSDPTPKKVIIPMIDITTPSHFDLPKEDTNSPWSSSLRSLTEDTPEPTVQEQKMYIESETKDALLQNKVIEMWILHIGPLDSRIQHRWLKVTADEMLIFNDAKQDGGSIYTIPLNIGHTIINLPPIDGLDAVKIITPDGNHIVQLNDPKISIRSIIEAKSK